MVVLGCGDVLALFFVALGLSWGVREFLAELLWPGNFRNVLLPGRQLRLTRLSKRPKPRVIHLITLMLAV